MSERHTPTIVVINDEPTQLHMTASVLEQDGMKVIRCTGAEEALKILVEHPAVDALITDLHMPRIDGWRLCRLLRSPEYAAYNKIPILVVSATFFGVDAEQVTADLGANAFLPIPYDPATLRACTRKLLNGGVPPATLRVLIVEDSRTQAEVLRTAFESRGWTVWTAGTGEEGRRLYHEVMPEIVILDYHLPDTRGDELLADVKPPGASTVAIVITADPTPSRSLECMQRRADGYVRKPFDPQYLIGLCERARRERSFLRVEELLEDRTRDLRESETRFRSLLESIPEVIIVRDGGGIIRHVNEAGARRLEWSPDELIGQPYATLLGTSHAAQSDTAGPRAQPCADTDTCFVTRTGMQVPMEVNERSIVFNGRSAILEVARDVTERKQAEAEKARLEEQLRQSQKMEAIGTLAGGVAHDFNNLLTAILGHAHLLKLRGQPDDPVFQGAAVIETAVQRAKQLTEQLLGFARHGKHQNILFDMHATIRDVITLLSRTIDKRIVFQENFNTPRSRIVGDPSQLHQVILNLALNARDAMPDGGVITCSTRVASAEASDRRFTGISAHEYLVISIADTGCGIAKDILGRIFEPFFTTKGPGKGTGMGLAMVYGIVHNHGGYLEVESEVGCGTTFHLYLPLANGHATPVAAPPASVPEPGRGRILVVDDEPLVRDVAGNMLVHLGYQILKAGDGEEAVEYYRAYQHEIVLVMIDMIMPRMNGRDCFRKLKQINPDVKAVLCTGYDRNLGVQEILDEGMHGFVQKPYDLAQLSNVVSQALQGSGRHKK